MTIQDARYGGELITLKGQVLKFHSAGCMIKYYKAHEFRGGKYTWILVTDYERPGVLINVNDAVFVKLIHGDGPMGDSLIAVSKTAYSHSGMKEAQWKKGMYWREVLWKYH
jgi:copper chaperone NosL